MSFYHHNLDEEWPQRIHPPSFDPLECVDGS